MSDKVSLPCFALSECLPTVGSRNCVAHSSYAHVVAHGPCGFILHPVGTLKTTTFLITNVCVELTEFSFPLGFSHCHSFKVFEALSSTSCFPLRSHNHFLELHDHSVFHNLRGITCFNWLQNWYRSILYFPLRFTLGKIISSGDGEYKDFSLI